MELSYIHAHIVYTSLRIKLYSYETTDNRAHWLHICGETTLLCRYQCAWWYIYRDIKFSLYIAVYEPSTFTRRTYQLSAQHNNLNALLI